MLIHPTPVVVIIIMILITIINIYIYIYTFLPHAVSASATAIHSGSLRGPTSTREVIKRGRVHMLALVEKFNHQFVSVCRTRDRSQREGGTREGRGGDLQLSLMFCCGARRLCCGARRLSCGALTLSCGARRLIVKGVI